MIVMDNKNLINGSSALAPKFKPNRQNENGELEKLKKQQKDKQKALAEEKLVKQAKVLGVIVCSFLVGLLLIGRYASVYNMQKDISKIKIETNNLKMENEDLMVQLIKAGNIKQVEETAKNKLNMVTPDKNKVVYLEATKDYFAKNTKEKSKNTQEDFIAKIKNMLF